MWINADVIIKVAALLGAVTAIGSAIFAVYRFVVACKATGKRSVKTAQELEQLKGEVAGLAEIKENMSGMKAESAVICRSLRGVLQGLIERGCNGPCKNALEELDEYLNREAHGL